MRQRLAFVVVFLLAGTASFVLCEAAFKNQPSVGDVYCSSRTHSDFALFRVMQITNRVALCRTVWVYEEKFGYAEMGVDVLEKMQRLSP